MWGRVPTALPLASKQESKKKAAAYLAFVDSVRQAENVQSREKKKRNAFAMDSGGVYMGTVLHRGKAEVPLCVPELEVSGKLLVKF